MNDFAEDTLIQDIPVDSVPDLEAVPDGEHKVQLARYELAPNKRGDGVNVVVYLHPNDLENVYDLRMWLPLPSTNDDKERAEGKVRRLRQFANAFGFTLTSTSSGAIRDAFNTGVGSSAWITVNTVSQQNETTGELVELQNVRLAKKQA